MSRVLHVNHTAVVGGAERSLLALLDHTDRSRIAGVCCPPGPLADEVARRDLPWFPTAEPEARFDASIVDRTGAVARLARIGPAVEFAARRSRADVVHANSIRTALGVTLSTRRLVTHVRDVLPSNGTARAVKRVLVARSSRIVGISTFVAARFAEDLPRPGRWSVVDNPIDLRRFPVRPPSGRRADRERLGFDPSVPLALTIGQITPWKRQVLAIESVAACLERGRPVHLAIVGSVKFTEGRTGTTNRAYESLLRRRVDELGLGTSVTFLGERDDVEALLGGTDVVLIPSEDEPFGRVAAEAIASGVPVVTSGVGGPADVINRCGGGVAVRSDQPDRWAGELASLLAAHDESDPVISSEAIAAVRAAFDAERHAASMADVFDDVASGG